MSAPNQSTIYIHDRMRELAFENALNVTDAKYMTALWGPRLRRPDGGLKFSIITYAKLAADGDPLGGCQQSIVQAIKTLESTDPIRHLHMVRPPGGDQNSSLPPGPAIPQYMNPMSFFSIWETYTGQINAKRHSPNFVVEYARLSPDNEERQGKVLDLIQEIIDSRDEHQGRCRSSILVGNASAGSGKTDTIADLIVCFLSLRIPVLVASRTHVATDEVVQRAVDKIARHAPDLLREILRIDNKTAEDVMERKLEKARSAAQGVTQEVVELETVEEDALKMMGSKKCRWA